MVRTFVVLCVALALGAPSDGGQQRQDSAGEVKALAAGTLLVASRQLRDPNFAETVVLLMDYDKDGAAGLIINVQSDVRLARVFEHVNLGANATQLTFSGGPVARTSAVALVRSRPAATGTRTIVPGVDLISTRDRLEQSLVIEKAPDRFRVYLGRSGWGPGQLERETLGGAWHLFTADAERVFDPNPGTLWRRMIRLTEMLQARIARPGVSSAL